MIQRIRGTQDFLDLKLFNYFLRVTKKHLTRYNFSEIATPLIEPLELFKRSLGQETDVVSKEMYIIPDEDGDHICLRPEATASVVRAFINNGIDQLPWKVFLWGPMFRRERPQKGRYRQFHQVSIEIIGSGAIEQDAELIKMLDLLFNVQLNMNNYAIKLNFLGCPEDRVRYKAVLKEFLDTHTSSLCSTCLHRKDTNILRVFDCKNETCQQLYKNAPAITEYLCHACADEWQSLQQLLAHLSVSYTITPHLVRGLDYYSKTVFEFVSMHLGAQNAFCGGGRYDSLIKELGGKQDQPSVGAAIGIERVLMLLEEHGDQINIKEEPLTVIIPLASEQTTLALLLADSLHNQGLKAEVLFEGSIKSMMRKADRMQAHYVCIIGKDEQESRSVSFKNMKTGQELKGMLQSEVGEFIKKGT